MSSQNNASPVALSYAQSLLELAENNFETIGAELAQFAAMVKSDKSFRMFLADPSVKEAHRLAILKKSLGGQVAPLLLNFLGVLNAKGRLGMLDEIAGAYRKLVDQKQNKIDVEVTVAQELTPDQLEQVRWKVSTALQKTAVIRQKVDSSIIGGLILRVQDKLIDSSVKYQLQAMKQQLLAAK